MEKAKTKLFICRPLNIKAIGLCVQLYTFFPLVLRVGEKWADFQLAFAKVSVTLLCSSCVNWSNQLGSDRMQSCSEIILNTVQIAWSL